MSLLSQLSLSVELTKLLPVTGVAAVTSAAYVFKWARELQASGSDIVLEEDIAEVFARNKIDPMFEEEFRKAVTPSKTASDNSSIYSLGKLLPIVLQIGAGPTIQRALTKQSAHCLPTVIQLSLLAATHDLQSLSEGLAAEALRLRSQDRSTGIESSHITSKSLLGLLTACSD